VGPAALLDFVDGARRTASAARDRSERAELGQFMTPGALAAFMARAFESWPEHVRLLDPGAGVGSLTAAVVAEACARAGVLSIEVDLYELDASLLRELDRTVRRCRELCDERGVAFRASVHGEDFVPAALGERRGSYNRVIVNPPYRKLNGSSPSAETLRRAGLPATNLYAAFLALCVRRLDAGGELVAITPRSFCNGPYFKRFRRMFLAEMALSRLHVFDSRRSAFGEDRVLQENLILCAVKGAERRRVLVSSSPGLGDEGRGRLVARERVVWPDDRDLVIHLAPSLEDAAIAERMRALPCELSDLGLSVSTGKVVDFRLERFLRRNPGRGTVPLIYPLHLGGGGVRWPDAAARKPNAIVASRATSDALVPRGYYALTKRFTSKEEPRRIVAAVFDPRILPAPRIGFENHVNYFHRGGAGIARDEARGLACFLNSTLVDRYFRQFSGHTQVNAADLRRLRYPSPDQLRSLAGKVGKNVADQRRVDAVIASDLP